MTLTELQAWITECAEMDREQLYQMGEKSLSDAFDRGYCLGCAHTFEAVLQKIKQLKLEPTEE